MSEEEKSNKTMKMFLALCTKTLINIINITHATVAQNSSKHTYTATLVLLYTTQVL